MILVAMFCAVSACCLWLGFVNMVENILWDIKNGLHKEAVSKRCLW